MSLIDDDAIDASALAAQHAIVERASDVRLPVPDDDNFATYGADEQITRMCRLIEWDAERAGEDIERDVLMQFCTLLPTLGLIVHNGNEDSAEFRWASIRCLLAGAGWASHASLATHLRTLYHDCPLDPAEPMAEWLDKLNKAHGICGWPCVIAWLDAPSVGRALGMHDRDVLAAVPAWGGQWLTALAMLHLLKHMRHDQRGHAALTYGGRAAFVAYEQGTNILSKMRRLRETVWDVLRFPIADQRARQQNPLGQAARRLFDALPVSALLRRVALASLPGNVLAGSWSQLVPCPDNAAPGLFARTGLKLANVWCAVNGHVTEIPGDNEQVVTYAWNLTELTDSEGHALELFRHGVPETYLQNGYPSTDLFAAFPNASFVHWKDQAAACSLLDALVCHALLRPEILATSTEFPFVLAMPTEPTPESSTNQGKTTFAYAIARMLSLDVPCTQAADVDSAPASRSLAAAIERYGTLCLDEYRPVKSKSHLLAHDSLQAMCTGQAVNMGRVMSNDISLVRLRQSMVASCKAADFPPDIVNRSLFFWLDTMSDAQRADVETAQYISSGQLSLRCRLAGVALIERLRLGGARPIASSKLRFPVLFGLAVRIYMDRCKCDEQTAILELESALAAMRHGYDQHQHLAEDSGLLAQLEDAQAIRLRATTVFDGVTGDEMHQFAQLLDARADSSDRFTASVLLKARGELAGAQGATSLARIAALLTGNRYSSTDRAIALALGRDLCRHMPTIGAQWTLPDLLGMNGWYLERCTDAGPTARFRMFNDPARAVPEFTEATAIPTDDMDTAIL